jgi:protein CpxP
MRMERSLIPILPLIAVIAAGVAGAPAPAAAQGAPPTPPMAHMQRMQRASHIEGRIAFLRAELKITPAQEATFSAVADAMRADVQDMRKVGEQWMAHRTLAPTAVQVLEMRANFTALRAKGEERFLAAFRPFYDSLSAEQKRVADGLLRERHMR